MAEPSENELDAWMARLSQGDREAFDPLFRALYPRALRVAQAKLPFDDAADVAQTILMKVFARANDFGAGRPALPWFYAVAANEILAARRRRAKRRVREQPQDEAPDVADARESADAEGALLETELRGCLRRAIAELDDTSAEAIRSMLGEGVVPGAGSAAFRKRVSRAYARLRTLLGGFHAS